MIEMLLNIKDSADATSHKSIQDLLHRDSLKKIISYIQTSLFKLESIKEEKDIYNLHALRRHQSIMLDGDRGSGKTTLLLNLKTYCKEYIKNYEDKMIVLEPFDPKRFSRSADDLLPAIIAHIVEELTNNGMINEANVEKSLFKLGQMFDKNKNQSGIDTIYSLHKTNQIDQVLHEFFISIGKLVVLPIDDIDMADGLCEDIIEIICTYLTSPFLLPIVAFDFEYLYKQLIRFQILENEKIESKLYNIKEEELAKVVESQLIKIFPLNRRVFLPHYLDLSFYKKIYLKFSEFKKITIEDLNKSLLEKLYKGIDYNSYKNSYLYEENKDKKSLIIKEHFYNIREFVQFCLLLDSHLELDDKKILDSLYQYSKSKDEKFFINNPIFSIIKYNIQLFEVDIEKSEIQILDVIRLSKEKIIKRKKHDIGRYLLPDAKNLNKDIEKLFYSKNLSIERYLIRQISEMIKKQEINLISLYLVFDFFWDNYYSFIFRSSKDRSLYRMIQILNILFFSSFQFQKYPNEIFYEQNIDELHQKCLADENNKKLSIELLPNSKENKKVQLSYLEKLEYNEKELSYYLTLSNYASRDSASKEEIANAIRTWYNKTYEDYPKLGVSFSLLSPFERNQIFYKSDLNDFIHQAIRYGINIKNTVLDINDFLGSDFPIE